MSLSLLVSGCFHEIYIFMNFSDFYKKMGESSDLPYEVVTKPQVNSMLKYIYYTNIRKNKIVLII